MKIPLSLLNDPHGEALYAEIMAASAALGRGCLESQKQMARDAGLSELPACEITVNGRLVRLPAVDLTVKS